jgi:plastocyanin
MAIGIPVSLLSVGHRHTAHEHTFTQAGTCPYYCSVHFSLGMTTITVR